MFSTQLCINTAIVYMHRFYVFHSLSQFHRNAIASAALFLAAKVEEQPRKLEHVIKVAHMCLHRDQTPPDTRSEVRLRKKKKLRNEKPKKKKKKLKALRKKIRDESVCSNIWNKLRTWSSMRMYFCKHWDSTLR